MVILVILLELRAPLAPPFPHKTPFKTLNAGFRLAYPIDYEPESGRVDLRCHSAKALLAYPQLRSISQHQGKVLKNFPKGHNICPLAVS